ncbi:MAG: flavodoxin [Prevotellaceae bacterium]|nr:flavodoxin [Prevotellaceae bacterium]
MKYLKFLLLTVLTVFAASACSQNIQKSIMKKKKVLVVYFSATGTTRQVAKQIAEIADADICEIVPVKPYSDADLDWTNKQSRSSVEMSNPKARPEIKVLSIDVSKYDYVFLGYPIWWDLAPRTVNLFIEAANLTGKTVIPFATSGSSPIANSVAVLKKSYPKIKWQTGKLLNRVSEKEIGTWVSETIK